jgi:hypothetical protein
MRKIPKRVPGEIWLTLLWIFVVTLIIGIMR